MKASDSSSWTSHCESWMSTRHLLGQKISQTSDSFIEVREPISDSREVYFDASLREAYESAFLFLDHAIY
jgi:hypothetical protein